MEDCFAYIKEGVCFALTKMECDNCPFYKHSENPDKDRKDILAEIYGYEKKGKVSKH